MNKVYLTGLFVWTGKVGAEVEPIPKKSNGWFTDILLLIGWVGVAVKSMSIISNMLFVDCLTYCFDVGGEDSVLTNVGVDFYGGFTSFFEILLNAFCFSYFFYAFFSFIFSKLSLDGPIIWGLVWGFV